MQMIIKFQQVLYFIALILWGQASVRYALDNSYGNRFESAVIITSISLIMLVISYKAPQYLSKITSVIGVVVISFFAWVLHN